jgi:glucokinase
MQVADVRKQRQDPHATSGAGIAPVPRYARDAVAPFIAADIGGTHARVGLVVADRGGAPSVRVLHYHRYRCAEWANLTSLLQNFLEELAANPSVAGTRVSRCVVACAGYVLDERIVNENLPWPVSVRDIREHLGIAQIEVLNDFAAVAWATQ